MSNVDSNPAISVHPSSYWPGAGLQGSGWHYILYLSVLFPTTTNSQSSSHIYVKQKHLLSGSWDTWTWAYVVVRSNCFDMTYRICCMMFNLLLQVRPCWDAVRCFLGEQLLGHVGLHPLCLLRLCLPPVPAHHLLLSAEGLWLWPHPNQVIPITNARSTSVIPWVGMYLCIEAWELRHIVKKQKQNKTEILCAQIKNRWINHAHELINFNGVAHSVHMPRVVSLPIMSL